MGLLLVSFRYMLFQKNRLRFRNRAPARSPRLPAREDFRSSLAKPGARDRLLRGDFDHDQEHEHEKERTSDL